MPFPLLTERLLLRRFHESDLDAFRAYRNDPEVFQYQGWQTPYLREMAAEFIAEMKDAIPGREGYWFQAAIQRRSDYTLLGDVAFCPQRGNPRQAYLGFTLARRFWGQGYAGEAVGAVLGFLFGELDMHRLIAVCDAENANSYRLLERLGFRREAHHVESYPGADGWRDEYVYALLEREWPRP
ncbi:MAG: GNAT family N-acetyltransferase [Chloroflexota bacterium]|jgi:aminoglycoside 6'-N-acetyltransferase